jgi:hypothetical protein
MTIRAYTLGDIINETLEKDSMYPPLQKVLDEKVKQHQPGQQPDMVNRPPHYTLGGIETIDYMKAKASPAEFHGHLRLTAIKYLSRGPYKADALEDYQKARWYLDRLINELESLKKGHTTGSMDPVVNSSIQTNRK